MTTPIPRSEFAVAETHVYLDHAGVAPVPRRCVHAIGEWLEHAYRKGALESEFLRDRVDATRTLAARLCGVPPDDLAFVKNTTEGIAFVASGLEWREGDRVVVADREFPSTIFPWLALEDLGVEVERIQPTEPGGAIPLELFEEALARAPVRVVCVSWVQFSRGWRTDIERLAELCHAHGALLCVDAIQGLGLLPASLARWGVDFAAADGHKWMCAPEGLGILYVPERNRDMLRPLEPGWHSVAHRREWDNLDLVRCPTARCFEGGTHNAAGIFGLGASLELLLEAGIETIWTHVDGLVRRAEEGLHDVGAEILSDRSGDGASGILTFRMPGQDPAETNDHLKQQGFVASAPRGGGIRVSPHGYNTPEEIDLLVQAVRPTS